MDRIGGAVSGKLALSGEFSDFETHGRLRRTGLPKLSDANELPLNAAVELVIWAEVRD